MYSFHAHYEYFYIYYINIFYIKILQCYIYKYANDTRLFQLI